MLDGGTRGLRHLVALQFRWRGDLRDYAVATLLVPVSAFIVLCSLSLISPDLTPGVLADSDGRATLLLISVVGGLIAGGLEEIGWTGFALRRLPSLLPTVRTGMALGFVHAIWHLPAGFWGEGVTYGLLYVPYFLIAWTGGLIALRILICWLYRRTGSLILAQLAHASYTGSLLALWPMDASPLQTIAWTAVFVMVLLGFVGMLAVLSRRPSPHPAPDGGGPA
jgi:membrane protease YdiL (CAAX protease family)